MEQLQPKHLYIIPFIYLLQFLMIVNFIAAVVKHQLLQSKKWGFLLLHIAFVIILCGAMVCIFLVKKVFSICVKEKPVTNSSTNLKRTINPYMPFQVELIKFTMTRYPGSHSPSSYESDLIFHVDGQSRNLRVFMNM